MDIFIMKFITIILLLYSFISIKKMKKNQNIIINDKFWLLVTWCTCLFLYFFSGIEYPISLDLKTFIYILLFWFLYLLGRKISQMVFINKSKSKKSDKVEIIKNVNLFPLFMFSFFCLLMYILVMYRLNPNILFGITRNVKINSLATLFLFLSSSSLIIWLYNLIQFLINKQKIRLYTYVSALIYNIPGILISGRDALIIFILSSLIVIIYSLVYIKNNEKLNYNIKRKMRKLLLISFLLIMLYLLFVSNTRYGSNSSDVVDMFKWASGNAVFPDYLLNIYYSTGIIGKLLLNIVFYYTSQFSKFALAYNNFNGPYMHGLHQLHYLARALPSSFGINPNTTSIAVTNMCSNERIWYESFMGYINWL